MTLCGTYVVYAELQPMWITLELPSSPPAADPSSSPPAADPSSSPAAPGLECPRCHSRRAQRWGRFGQRQRYRCRGCGKTYNALTGTPLARLKHRDMWAEFGLCLLEGLSVRGSAEVLGISPSTAFRWRHRFLDTLRANKKPRVTGVPEPTLANLIAYRRRLFDWAEPFRGVSARHYSNYLTWFHFVDEHRDLNAGDSLTSLLSQLFPTLKVNGRRGRPDGNRIRPVASLHHQVCGSILVSANSGRVQSLGTRKRKGKEDGDGDGNRDGKVGNGKVGNGTENGSASGNGDREAIMQAEGSGQRAGGPGCRKGEDGKTKGPG